MSRSVNVRLGRPTRTSYLGIDWKPNCDFLFALRRFVGFGLHVAFSAGNAGSDSSGDSAG